MSPTTDDARVLRRALVDAILELPPDLLPTALGCLGALRAGAAVRGGGARCYMDDEIACFLGHFWPGANNTQHGAEVGRR